MASPTSQHPELTVYCLKRRNQRTELQPCGEQEAAAGKDEVDREESASGSYPTLPVGTKLPRFLKHGALSLSPFPLDP